MFLLLATPEKQPALLSIVYTAGLALLGLLLLVSLLRLMRRRRSALAAVAPADLPPEVRDRLGTTSADRGLRALRVVFVLLALTVFGFHVYWAKYAEESNERFQQLSYKDLRNRRLAESTLRGWILDRTGSLDRALAHYKRAPNGQINREYPLDMEMAQLFGSDRGDPGLERALFGVQSGAAPEALDVVMEREVKQPGNIDVRLTIDSELQKTAVELLKGRHGAVVVLNPQTGEVLAMYSNPAYSLKEAQDEAAYIRLEANDRDKPLVNRALGAYYIPGSTFKTVTMLAAFNAGMQNEQFNCTGAGYYAEPGAKPIFDAGGAGEVHGRIGIDTAYEVSCNQYFAQMAIKLGPERMADAARLIGITPYTGHDGRDPRSQAAADLEHEPAVGRARARAARGDHRGLAGDAQVRPRAGRLRAGLLGADDAVPDGARRLGHRQPRRQGDEAEDRVRRAARGLRAVHHAAARGGDAAHHGPRRGRLFGHGHARHGARARARASSRAARPAPPRRTCPSTTRRPARRSASRRSSATGGATPSARPTRSSSTRRSESTVGISASRRSTGRSSPSPSSSRAAATARPPPRPSPQTSSSRRASWGCSDSPPEARRTQGQPQGQPQQRQTPQPRSSPRPRASPAARPRAPTASGRSRRGVERAAASREVPDGRAPKLIQAL